MKKAKYVTVYLTAKAEVTTAVQLPVGNMVRFRIDYVRDALEMARNGDVEWKYNGVEDGTIEFMSIEHQGRKPYVDEDDVK